MADKGSKPLTFNELMKFKYSDVAKHGYAVYYRQEPDGTLTETTQAECFDFSDKSRRIRFFADPESGLCVQLAKVGGNLETACFAAQYQFAKRLADGREPSQVYSSEEYNYYDDEFGVTFDFDTPDLDADTAAEIEQNTFSEWVESRLTVEERGLYRAVKAGYTANSYAKLMAKKNPDLKPNSVWRKYDRMMSRLLIKVETLRAEWDAQ